MSQSAKIDAHQHFWNYDPAQYTWIGESMAALRRDFLPTDLRLEIDSVGIDGVVAVQARQTVEETWWLLELADRYDFIQGVVGWVPLAAIDVRRHLDELSGRPRLKGVRHVVQDEPDERFILGRDFNRGVMALRDYGLTYDVLIYERHLPQAIEFVDRHPQQVLVLDHLAKPPVAAGQLEPWKTHIARLAKREHVYCKISGLVTEADWKRWTASQLDEYLDTILAAFGPQRVMFGSDWPVCLLASMYSTWYEMMKSYCATFSTAEQDRIFGGTAMEAYRLRR
jgi:L-fuconolactonase